MKGLKGKLYSRIIFFAFSVCSVMGCKQNELYEKLVNVPGGKWKQMEKLTFDIHIPDSSRGYYLLATIRHTGMYPYRNIWVRLGLQQPGSDTISYQDFDIPLASNENWLGTGVGNVFDRRVRLFRQPVQFLRTGKAKFTLEHIMRDGELPGVLHAGLRIEPALP